MLTHAKNGPARHQGHRPLLGDMVDLFRRAKDARSERRALRPLQEIDGWSDQAEVAYYEDSSSSRCG